MIRKRFTLGLAAAALLGAVLAGPLAAEQKASLVSKTKSVAAFKNGLGFFVRDGEAALSDGWAVWDMIPPAALGAFWVGSPKQGVSIERLIASEEEVTKTIPAISISEILAANVGKEVTLTVTDRSGPAASPTKVTGKIISVPDERKPPADQSRGGAASTRATIVLIAAPEGTLAINKDMVTGVQFAGEANSNYTSKEKARRLRFKVSGAKDKAPVTIAYLQKGFSWSPAYLVELLDDKKARVTMQGLLINDVEDIEGANVSFVVGYPNFVAANITSPLALTQSLADFVTALGRGSDTERRDGTSHYTTQSVSAFYAYDNLSLSYPAGPQFGYSTGKDTPGAAEEDLFLYQVKDVSLKKGERAYYTVFSAEAPYEHIYEWVIPDTSRVQPNGYIDSNRRSDEVTPPTDQVWHKLKLTNNSPYPWTTAPAMAMSNGQPLSQDSIDYTPKGAPGELRITVATDIKAGRSEVEKSREPFQQYGYSFQRVVTDGKLTLKNFKSKAIVVTVKAIAIGEVSSTSPQATVKKTTEGLKAVNPTSVMTWSVPLNPGEEKSLDYSYTTNVRY